MSPNEADVETPSALPVHPSAHPMTKNLTSEHLDTAGELISSPTPDLRSGPPQWKECPGMVATLNLDGRFSQLNDRWSDLGYAPSQLAGRLWTDLIHENQRLQCIDIRDRFLQPHELEVRIEARTRSSEGSFCWLRWILTKPAEAERISVLAIDLGEQHEAFEQYRLGIEASPTGLIAVDDHGVIHLVNRQIEIMFGYHRNELLGKSVDKLVPERFRGGHASQRERFIASPSTRTMGEGRELYGVRKDGSEFPVEIGLNPVPSSDTGPRVLASIIDATSRKQHEGELQTRVAELQRYQEEMDLLSEMSSLLQHALKEDEAHSIVASFGKRLLDSVAVSIYAFPPSHDSLELTSHWGGGIPEERFGPHDCWALRLIQTHRSSLQSSPRCSHGWDHHPVWQICVPMSAHGQSSGVISLSSDRVIDESERRNVERVCKAMADQLALALTNIQLRETLRSLAIRDPLTGLFNRRYLEDTVSRELPRAERRTSRISVMMIDVDHFKRFNDTQGHQAADDALRGFGQLLNKAFRQEDIACRFGGEEFVAVLPDCPLEDGILRADDFRKTVANSGLGFTISVGVAEWPRNGRSWEVVLRKADEALYAAKSSGRNRVSSAQIAEQDGLVAA